MCPVSKAELHVGSFTSGGGGLRGHYSGECFYLL